MPFGWPILFGHFIQSWEKNKLKDKPLNLGFLSALKLLFRSPKQLFFYLPILGWIPLLLKGLRKKTDDKMKG